MPINKQTLLIWLGILFAICYQTAAFPEAFGKLNFWNYQVPKEQKYWHDKGAQELKHALKRKINTRRAKNIIIFIGDGMGPNTVTAARIYEWGEEGNLSWERFPAMGLLKTYCADKQVPDSFSTATALFSGVKVNYETGGVDASVKLANCSAALDPKHHVESILKWSQDAGKRTGLVTTTRVTHATPAALYAHSADRRWECEDKMTNDAKTLGCKDIARQLVEDATGRGINVILGGGRQMLVSGVQESPDDPIDTWSCNSKDGRNLIEDWKNYRSSKGDSYAFVENSGELNHVNAENVDYLMGIFANGHLMYEHERDKSAAGMPSLKDMTLKAINVLKKKNSGFLLMVEGGMIDQAHHRGNARKALNEVLGFNEAIEAALGALNKQELQETLIVVTADHAHTLTINGHPNRGADILGLAGNSRTEGTPYTTLTYGTTYQGFQVDANGKRVDPSQTDTTDWEYTQQGAINTDENYHGGSDVTVHARGPWAHLFHGVHEQSYVAHVIAYAANLSPFRSSPLAGVLGEDVPE